MKFQDKYLSECFAPPPLLVFKPQSKIGRGGGEQELLGTFQIWASGMLQPKLRHNFGSLVCSEIFFVKKRTLRRSIHFLKIQWKIHFSTFWNIDQNTPKKNLEGIYGPSYFKSAFGINFRLREGVKRKFCQYAYLHIFSWTTSWSSKLILKADFKKMSILLF